MYHNKWFLLKRKSRLQPEHNMVVSNVNGGSQKTHLNYKLWLLFDRTNNKHNSYFCDSIQEFSSKCKHLINNNEALKRVDLQKAFEYIDVSNITNLSHLHLWIRCKLNIWQFDQHAQYGNILSLYVFETN